MKGKCVIVMGVSGCGKSTIGEKIAEKMGVEFIEGDDFHSKANIDKMKADIPLTDADRQGWLESIHARILQDTNSGKNCVVSCSSLKLKYREVLSNGIEQLLFVYLDGSFELIHGWMAARKDHFMPVDLLQSQFDALQKPTAAEKNVVTIDINTTLEKEMAAIFQQLKLRHFINSSGGGPNAHTL